MAWPGSQSSGTTASYWDSGTGQSFPFPKFAEYGHHELPDGPGSSDHYSAKPLSGHNLPSPGLTSPLINLPVSFTGDAESHLSRSSSPDQAYATLQLPNFNIERDGDPELPWPIYYDFIVTKTGTYFRLQKGYVATEKFLNVVSVPKNIIASGNRLHKCFVLGCGAKPFSRHYDLERHFSSIHQGNERNATDDRDQSENSRMNCDYRKCPHGLPLRKDHCREHYREYHYEDLLKRYRPETFNSKRGKKKSETVEEFLARRVEFLNLRWWRCSKCLHRVKLTAHAYTCPTCMRACETERVTSREDALKAVRGDPKFLDSTPASNSRSDGVQAGI